MEISEIKKVLKTRGITYDELSRMSGVPKQTLTKIFAGFTKNPRIDTMQAIEQALGLSPEAPAEQFTLTDEHRHLIAAYDKLIPPMQEYVLSMVEGLTQQAHNLRRA